MCSPGVSARDRVLAELATLGGGGLDALGLLEVVRDLAGFADRVQGELARLTGVLDASGAAAEAGFSSAAGFLRHGCGRAPGRAGELVAAGRELARLPVTCRRNGCPAGSGNTRTSSQSGQPAERRARRRCERPAALRSPASVTAPHPP